MRAELLPGACCAVRGSCQNRTTHHTEKLKWEWVGAWGGFQRFGVCLQFVGKRETARAEGV